MDEKYVAVVYNMVQPSTGEALREVVSSTPHTGYDSQFLAVVLGRALKQQVRGLTQEQVQEIRDCYTTVSTGHQNGDTVSVRGRTGTFVQYTRGGKCFVWVDRVWTKVDCVDVV